MPPSAFSKNGFDQTIPQTVREPLVLAPAHRLLVTHVIVAKKTRASALPVRRVARYDSAAALYRAVLDQLADTGGDPRLDTWRCRAWLGLVADTRIMDRNEDALALLDGDEAVARTHGLVEELADICSLRGNL